jgi:hypothetical protein
MSIPNAMAETLHRLFTTGHGHVADMLLQRCSRGLLEELLVSSKYVLSGRIRYAVEDRLKHRRPNQEDRVVPPLKALLHMLNTWCIEGRRTAIRAVLSELSDNELDEMGHMPELEGEVASMMREFHT